MIYMCGNYLGGGRAGCLLHWWLWPCWSWEGTTLMGAKAPMEESRNVVVVMISLIVPGHGWGVGHSWQRHQLWQRQV